MRVLTSTIAGLWRPLALGLLLVIGLGLLSADPRTGTTGASGFVCKGFTDDAVLNRRICRLHPARLWNMPVSEVFRRLTGG